MRKAAHDVGRDRVHGRGETDGVASQVAGGSPPPVVGPTSCASGYAACPTGGLAAGEVAAAVADGRCPLSVLGVGCRGRVCAVGGEADLRRRLLEMGFCGNARVEVVRRSPFGDPIEFRLRGYHLSLRGEDARHVTIVPDAPAVG